MSSTRLTRGFAEQGLEIDLNFLEDRLPWSSWHTPQMWARICASVTPQQQNCCKVLRDVSLFSGLPQPPYRRISGGHETGNRSFDWIRGLVRLIRPLLQSMGVWKAKAFLISDDGVVVFSAMNSVPTAKNVSCRLGVPRRGWG